MKDPQLALLLCRLLHGTAGSAAEIRLLQQLRETAEGCASGDAAAAAAACCWLQGDADAAVEVMLRSERAKLRAAATAEHAAQLLPLLQLLLTADPPQDARQQADWQRHVRRCMCALTAALQGCGLHALAIQAAVAARLDSVHSDAGPAGQQHELLEQVLAVALLPGVVEQHERGQRHLEADAAYQLEMLQQQGIALDSPAILAHLRRLRRGVLMAGRHSHSGAWAQPVPGPRPLERQLSSGSSSYRSRDSEQARWQLTQQQQQQRHGMAVLSDGWVPCCRLEISWVMSDCMHGSLPGRVAACRYVCSPAAYPFAFSIPSCMLHTLSSLVDVAALSACTGTLSSCTGRCCPKRATKGFQ